jgi:molybdate transport system permease protein
VRTFFRVTLPLARGGLVAGEAVALARGLGEFGATIMFAGSLQGRTQTLPLAIYQQFAAINGFNVALAISALLVIVSLAILLSLKLSGLWARTRPAVPVLAGPNDLERTAGG